MRHPGRSGSRRRIGVDRVTARDESRPAGARGRHLLGRLRQGRVVAAPASGCRRPGARYRSGTGSRRRSPNRCRSPRGRITTEKPLIASPPNSTRASSDRAVDIAVITVRDMVELIERLSSSSVVGLVAPHQLAGPVEHHHGFVERVAHDGEDRGDRGHVELDARDDEKPDRDDDVVQGADDGAQRQFPLEPEPQVEQHRHDESTTPIVPDWTSSPETRGATVSTRSKGNPCRRRRAPSASPGSVRSRRRPGAGSARDRALAELLHLGLAEAEIVGGVAHRADIGGHAAPSAAARPGCRP